jgi:hypothetical protein
MRAPFMMLSRLSNDGDAGHHRRHEQALLTTSPILLPIIHVSPIAPRITLATIMHEGTSTFKYF